MYWLEHGGEFHLGILISRGCESERAHDCRAEVGKNVAEEIGANHHIEPLGMADEMRRENIYVILIGADVGKFLRDDVQAFIPERHGVNDAVRFRRRSYVRLARAGQAKSVAQNAIYAAAGEDGLLDR